MMDRTAKSPKPMPTDRSVEDSAALTASRPMLAPDDRDQHVASVVPREIDPEREDADSDQVQQEHDDLAHGCLGLDPHRGPSATCIIRSRRS